MLEAEAWAARGVDLDDARDAEGIGIAGAHLLGRRGCSRPHGLLCFWCRVLLGRRLRLGPRGSDGLWGPKTSIAEISDSIIARIMTSYSARW